MEHNLAAWCDPARDGMEYMLIGCCVLHRESDVEEGSELVCEISPLVSYSGEVSSMPTVG